MDKYKIAVLVGSLRKESFSLKTAKNLKALAPESLSLEIVDLDNLPIYNQDLEAAPPNEWKNLRKQITSADGVLFVTPEYNRSIPAVLKNAIDIGSRPKENNTWNKKPGAIISISPGQLSAFGANHHLRQVLVPVNVPVMAQPEAYIGEAATLFDENGVIKTESTRDFLKMFLSSYEQWVKIHSGK